MNSETAQSEVSPVDRDAAGASRAALEAEFSALARLAALACGTHFAAVALNGSGTAWFAVAGSVPAGAARSIDAFSAVVAGADGVLEIPDVARDPRASVAAQAGEPARLQFFAGIALRGAGGDALGTLAVFDGGPRRLTPEQRAMLALVASQCVSQVELRARLAELSLAGSGLAGAPGFARALLESAPVAIYHTDGAGNSAYWNAAYRDIFGLRAYETDADWAECVHPEDRERMRQAWADFRARPRPVHFEYSSDPRRAASRSLSEKVVPVRGAAGFVGAITDVTDLTAARADLRRVETLFAHTFEQAPIGIAYQDRSGTFLRCNQAFCKLLGYAAPEEICSRTISDLTHPEDLAESLRAFERLWNGETQFIDY